MGHNQTRPGAEESARPKAARSDGGAGAADLEPLARAYWRLWRRNWRPPFAPGDAPAAADAQSRR